MTNPKPNKVYVASSWRNNFQPAVVATIRAAGIDVYDFKNPREGEHGFHWSEVMPSYQKDTGENQLANVYEYLEALNHSISEAGFKSDFDAMNECDTCILVLPCGRSAHGEWGWFAGQGRRTAILLDPDENDMVTPELMYKMADLVTPSMLDLLDFLGVED